MPLTPEELDLRREALATSTLDHGLQLLGDRWTMAVVLGAFLGVRRFDEWQSRLAIPRHTLAQRLRALTALGLLRQRPYQERPLRHAYHLTAKGLSLYPHVLMMWSWERRWGTRATDLPQRLVHAGCGHAFVPWLACGACHEKVGIGDLGFTLQPNAALRARPPARGRAPRLAQAEGDGSSRGLRVDRWALLIISAVLLGCHHFDELSHVLGIGSSVLSRRLGDMVDAGLLLCQDDLVDGRRRVYRLTPASRDLFGYILCFSSWAARHHFQEPSSIRPTHRACGHPFVPEVVCSHCRQVLEAREVGFEASAP
ncbi:HxlR-like helix-turn-helix [Variovorax sp. SRS16]|uniref:winged helix-turn-helix transcriptional regulator n=1 Tax=Variovorax sp. SRS16 TaxID=282217 RepID=UPI001318707D|nr:winged helix-turn-helix transcriptional regulator [Variovorax sp. SRS16]VTU13595.1 HxlR-like helix-turn-helix [Variovorax sp. SRS16]